MWLWLRVCSLVLWLVSRVYAQDLGQIIFPDNDTLLPEPTSEPSQPTRLASKPISKSLKMCKKYAEYVFKKGEGSPGERDTCKIYKPEFATVVYMGDIVRPMEFPHMALVGVQGREAIEWICGGSLISERFVLSAAHCITGSVKPKRVRLGDFNIKSSVDDEENKAKTVEFNIIETFVHPEYDEQTKFNDIVLYKLNKDVEFNEFVRPICLHTEQKLLTESGIISGWGSVDFGAPKSDLLLRGDVSYVPGKECSELLNTVLKKQGTEVRDDIMVCAGNFVKGTDACQGDSGGPLQHHLWEPYCMYTQVGITSFGVGCGYKEGEPRYPAVYTRVSKYVPWIESIVWP